MCHIQLFALSRWLAVTMPVEYYEFARGLQWSIPYFSLPWESGRVQSVMVDSNLPAIMHSEISENHKSGTYEFVQSVDGKLDMAASIGFPLTPMEYRLFFEVRNPFTFFRTIIFYCVE